jgi:hypothetical protein
MLYASFPFHKQVILPMTLVVLATIASGLALLSGIVAIGSGAHWHFTKMDIWRGRRNAILYVWVTASSIFSMAHLASLVTYGLEYHWAYRAADTHRWMSIHTAIAFLLITAHLYILRTLSKEGAGAEYLWGRRSAV